jgi:hypothetical protein
MEFTVLGIGADPRMFRDAFVAGDSGVRLEQSSPLIYHEQPSDNWEALLLIFDFLDPLEFLFFWL